MVLDRPGYNEMVCKYLIWRCGGRNKRRAGSLNWDYPNKGVCSEYRIHAPQMSATRKLTLSAQHSVCFMRSDFTVLVACF